MWQQDLETLIDGFHHSAWGLSHSRRVYRMTLDLACQEGMQLDEEAVLAAAYLHDLGALGDYRQPGVDHAERSVQLLAEMLIPRGFPVEKLPLVKTIVLGHTFDVRPTGPAEVACFHDADILDFMGYIGVTRLLSIAGKENWTPDVRSAVALLQHFTQQMPPLLVTPTAQRIGSTRLVEMQSYLDGLLAETTNLDLL
ncbi:MAG TPA: HD domain-containing protein [Anaerolineae bacterium]|nr:HD domain-containing protein [Anaerolineae bacterium]HQI86759.1 HD domain-containing protein [Anaerolineae bacterium]